MCVCYRPPAHTVCLNHEVVEFQPRTVTAPDLVSGANAYTYSIPPSPPVITVFCVIVSPSPRAYILLPPPSCTRQLRFSLYLRTRFYLPHITRVRSDRPPGRRLCLPASTACMCFAPMPAVPRSSSPCLYIFIGAIIWIMLQFLITEKSAAFQ